MKYVMAFDAGTTSNRAIVFDHQGEIVSVDQQEFSQIYPKPGWVEHDPMDIWSSQSSVARTALDKAGIKPEDITAIGITNQRETAIVWEEEYWQTDYERHCLAGQAQRRDLRSDESGRSCRLCP